MASKLFSVVGRNVFYQVSKNNFQFQRIFVNKPGYVKRLASTSSWASDRMQAAGETLTSAADAGPIEVTAEMLATPSPKVLKLVEEVLELNVVEVNQLIRNIQKRLGLSDSQMFSGGGGGGGSSGGAAAAVEVAAPEPVKEKEFFELKLTVVDAKAKIKIIKEVRTITGLGLKEAKELVEKAPIKVKDGLKKDEAEALKKVLVEAGATVEIL